MINYYFGQSYSELLLKLDDFTIYCTNEQTKKAFELGAPILKEEHFSPVCWKSELINPTAEQMIGWLESKGFYFRLNTNGCSVEIDYSCILEIVNTPRKKATLQAIDTALDYYINMLK